MKLSKFGYRGFSFLIFTISVLLFLGLGLVNIYQPTIINSDGSGSINIQYYTNDSNLINSKVIENLPFTEAEANTYFTSANSEVKSVKMFHSEENRVTYMVLDIDFKDINKISEAKGFSGVNASWTKTDSEKVFKWVILKNQLQNNSIGTLLYIFHFDGKVRSSNGWTGGDSVTWSINPETFDYSNDIVLTAFVKGKDKSSCGSFGIELPIIFMGGFVFSFIHKRNTNKVCSNKFNKSTLRMKKFSFRNYMWFKT